MSGLGRGDGKGSRDAAFPNGFTIFKWTVFYQNVFVVKNEPKGIYFFSCHYVQFTLPNFFFGCHVITLILLHDQTKTKVAGTYHIPNIFEGGVHR